MKDELMKLEKEELVKELLRFSEVIESLEFEKRLKILEKELIKARKDLEWANDFIRKYIPAFPSQIKKNNNRYILEQIQKELKKGDEDDKD